MDSIDEAIGIAPWVIDALAAFASKYPKVQLVTSSRVSGSYAERIPFVGVCLMPFTDKQQTEFVSRWFGTVKSKDIAAICEHLQRNPALADVVRNPLLATTMCALQEHNVPLPSSEIRLYQEWMNLLTGAYDVHKKVQRMRSPRCHLEVLAERIAWYLHERCERHASREALIDLSARVFDDTMRSFIATFETEEHYCWTDDTMDRDESARVLAELIEPCNILSSRMLSDRIGFTHLRYQEYLAARELRNNRAFAIAPLISSSWWKGALVLFARMQDSLEWIVECFAESEIDFTARENLLAMIDAGPRKERDKMRGFVERLWPSYRFQ